MSNDIKLEFLNSSNNTPPLFDSNTKITDVEGRTGTASLPVISQLTKDLEKSLSLKSYIQSHELLLSTLEKYANNPDKIPTLHYAVKMGDQEAVSILIESGMDVNKHSPAGPPIGIAFREKNISMIKHLVEKKCTLTHSLLEEAIISRFEEGIDFLVQSGMNANQCNYQKIVNAINIGDEYVVEKFVNLGFDLKKLNEEVLFHALQNKNIPSSLIQFLILHDIRCDFRRIQENRPPLTPRHFDNGRASMNLKIHKSEHRLITAAVNRGEISIISLLLEKGVKCDYESPYNTSFSCIYNNFNYNIEIKNELSDNPIYCAIKLNRPDILKLLLDHGAKFTFITERRLGTIRATTEKEWKDWHHLIFLQKEVGPNVQQKTFTEGLTDLRKKLDSLVEEKKLSEHTQQGILLMTAIQNRNPETVKLLLEQGHPIDFLGENQKKPIKYAVELGNREVIALLLMHGASWDGV